MVAGFAVAGLMRANWIFLTVLGLGLMGLALVVRLGVVNLDREEERRRDEAVVAAFPRSYKEINGLRYVIRALGTGDRPYPGSRVAVRYEARVFLGDVFDSSARVEPETGVARFQVGVSRLVRGLDEGLLGMRVGEKRTIIIPPHLAYGRRGREPDIPPDAVLVYDVELVAVE